MLIWDNAQTTLQKFCQDSSQQGIAFQNLMANHGYKQLLTMLGRQVTENTDYTRLVPEQRGFQVPPDCVWPKTLIIIDGSTTTPVTEEPSDRNWSLRTSGNQLGKPAKFHYLPRFGIGGGVLELDPIPSSAYVLKFIYEATERDLSQAKYITGSVTLTRGSVSVVGAGTVFNADMVGRYFQLTGDVGDRLPYRIREYVDATHLRLEQYYHGNNVSAAAFMIAEAFNLPADCEMLPLFFSAWQWWSSKGNITKAREFAAQWNTGIALAKKNHALTTRDSVIDGEIPAMPFDTSYPAYYPTSLVS